MTHATQKTRTLACAAALAALAGGAPARSLRQRGQDRRADRHVGPYSDLAGPGVVAAKMAVEDFIAKAKGDFKVEMVSADHQNKADIGSNKAREWFEREASTPITDVPTTSVALAVKDRQGEEPHR
jgi:branched-chain amino acid transport system substrate-binding protein